TQLDVGRIVWKRPKELVDIPNLIYREKLGPAQEVEFVGHGPNPWFIAASLAVATHKSLIFKVIPKTESHFLRGILKFNFWHLGDWLKVVVDDKLPTFDGQLVFSRCRSPQVFWVPLLEKALYPYPSDPSRDLFCGNIFILYSIVSFKPKAYAKLYGSYEVMASNGCLTYALMDMTGATVETIALQCDGKEREQFRMISEELDKHAIICVKSKESIPQNTYGLLDDCIYVIKNIKKPLGGSFRKTFSKDSSRDSASIRIMCTIASNHKKKDRESAVTGNSSSQFCFDVLDECTEVMIDLMQKNFKQFI
ncbi:unnamed protein product, partial [Oppiella nova]